MRTFIKIAIVLTGLVLISGAYILSTTGFFRSIDNTYRGDIERVGIVGAEDFAISKKDSFLIISSTDRAGHRDGDAEPGGLWMMDLSNGGRTSSRLTDHGKPINPHGISMIELDSGHYKLLAVNHMPKDGEHVSLVSTDLIHSIEEYHLSDGELHHVKSHEDELIFHPNDVVAISPTEFYFTNDHGSKTKLGLMLEDYLGVGRSSVVYYDGSQFETVAQGMAYANGIAYDDDRQLLYLACPREMGVRVYEVASDRSLTQIDRIDCNTGVDNIELDDLGQLWIGCHPDLLHFAAYSKGKKEYSPSEIISIDYRSKGDYTVTSHYISDGRDMSAATTAIPFGNEVFVGNVMDDHFIILDRSSLR